MKCSFSYSKNCFAIFLNLIYSVLKASTGSFLLAILAGIKPAIIVKIILITTKIIPPSIGNLDKFETPATAFITIFIGILSKLVSNSELSLEYTVEGVQPVLYGRVLYASEDNFLYFPEKMVGGSKMIKSINLVENTVLVVTCLILEMVWQ